MYRVKNGTRWRQRPDPPVVTFSPRAWLKLQHLCHAVQTEVGGYGIATDPEDPLYVDDVLVPKQACTFASVEFDMADAAGRFEDLAVAGLQPFQYSSVWVHTHPGDSASPSGTDEETFACEFTGPWAVMFILARGGATTCRLRVTATGMEVDRDLDVVVDWRRWPKLEESLDALRDGWARELAERVNERQWTYRATQPAVTDYRAPWGDSNDVVTPVTVVDDGPIFLSDVDLLDLEDNRYLDDPDLALFENLAHDLAKEDK